MNQEAPEQTQRHVSESAVSSLSEPDCCGAVGWRTRAACAVEMHRCSECCSPMATCETVTAPRSRSSQLRLQQQWRHFRCERAERLQGLPRHTTQSLCAPSDTGGPGERLTSAGARRARDSHDKSCLKSFLSSPTILQEYDSILQSTRTSAWSPEISIHARHSDEAVKGGSRDTSKVKEHRR